MKIAIIATPFLGGGRIRALAYKSFLESKNHRVDMLNVDEIWQSQVHFFYQRARAYLSDKEPRLMEKTADRLERKIKDGKYDVTIGVESLLSYVLSRDLGCLKIFSWEAMVADEFYFESCGKKHFDLDRVRRIRDMELEICEKSDYIVFPWETTENYVRKNIYDSSNLITIRYGCHPKSKSVQHFFPPSIVSLGGLRGHCQNAELLSHLTYISPYVIDAYGNRPERKHNMNYKGFAPSLDVLYHYQFGLNTISKDIFRQNHFSSRVLGYLAYGLPVLSPDWMQLSFQLKGCLPYNENNFVDLIDKYSDKRIWEKLSEEAHAQAFALDWAITLKPLEKIIAK
jgi:hypothetical protein